MTRLPAIKDTTELSLLFMVPPMLTSADHRCHNIMNFAQHNSKRKKFLKCPKFQLFSLVKNRIWVFNNVDDDDDHFTWLRIRFGFSIIFNQSINQSFYCNINIVKYYVQ